MLCMGLMIMPFPDGLCHTTGGNILRPWAGHVGGALLYLYPATGLHPAVGYAALSGLLKKLIALKGHNTIAMGVTRRTRKYYSERKP
jgi:hypothetical protein